MTIDLYTGRFWAVTFARVVRGAAVGGTSILGAAATDTIHSLPWQGLVVAVTVGALMSLFASLSAMNVGDATSTVVGLSPKFLFRNRPGRHAKEEDSDG